MPKAKHFIQDMAISFITLCKRGKNFKKLIIKSQDDEPDFNFTIPIKKIDESQRRFYSIVYSPDQIDADGHTTDASVIQKACYDFMKNLCAKNIDKKHSFEPIEGVYVAENWLVKEGDSLFPKEPVGSWAQGYIVENDQIWKEIQDGEIEAVSMGGHGTLVQIDKEDEEKNTQNLLEKIIAFLNKNINSQERVDDMDEKKVQDMIDASIKKAVEGLSKPLTKEETAVVLKAAIAETVKPITSKLEKAEKDLETLSKKTPGSVQDDQKLTKEQITELEKEGKAIADIANGTED